MLKTQIKIVPCCVVLLTPELAAWCHDCVGWPENAHSLDSQTGASGRWTIASLYPRLVLCGLVAQSVGRTGMFTACEQ